MQTLKLEDNKFETINEALDYMESIGGGYVEWEDMDGDIQLIYAQSIFEQSLELL